MFNQRPSRIIDPNNELGNIFAFEFDAFCSYLVMKMISEGRLI